MTLSRQILVLFLACVQVTLARSFEAVKPILEHSCLECHNSQKTKGGLNLETRKLLLEGGDDAEAIDFDNPEKSELLRRVLLPHTDDEFMPPSSQKNPRPALSSKEIDTLRAWITAKAPWPETVRLKHRERIVKKDIKDLTSISVYPAKISLETKRDSHRLVVLAHQSDATTIDISKDATIEIINPHLARIEGTTLYPLKDGETTVRIKYREYAHDISLIVKGVSKDRPVTFQQDVIPVLTAAGCNTGSCHGAARGQDGFMLSLFGYDPEGDYHRITHELSGRRINLAIPEDSLLLTKATGKVPHTGNKLFEKDSPFYHSLLEWIKNGAQADPTSIALPISIQVEPSEFLLEGSNQDLQLTVTAKYSDGTDRDVTSLSSFTTSNETSIAIDPTTGRASSRKQGEAFLMARFHTFTEGSRGIVIPKNLTYTKPDLITSNYIDEHVYQKLHKLRITPSETSSDDIFLRRIYLDLIGKLPTPAERSSFRKNTAPEKRAQLIDQLLAREEFTDLWVMKWAELIQIRSTGRAANTITPKAARLWHQWLHQQFKDKRPFNKIVYDLITARGGTFDNPATNFFKLEKDPKKITENVAQIFMGTRLQCAQCHNHPFDRWTQNDYFGFASFFSQIKRKGAHDAAEQVIYDGSGEIKHPVTNKDVPPQFLGGELVSVATNQRRHTVAKWLTEPGNPWFAKNIANIVWAHFFGIGIVEPVDDVRVSNPATNPQLLEALAKSFTDSNFSIHHLVREICNSETYQRSSRANESNQNDLTNFSRSRIRRLRAEVLIDTIAQSTNTQNKFTGLPRGVSATRIPDGNTTNYFLKTFGRATRQTVCSCEVKMEPNLSQALHLLNGDSTHRRIQQGKIVKNLLLKQKKSPKQIIHNLYLRTLTRPPTAEEQSKLLATLKPELPPKEQQAILEDIFWALLNSKEYLFNH